MAKKLKFEKDQEFELPEGFESIDEFFAKFNELQSKLPELQKQAQVAQKFAAWGDPETLEARLQAHVNQQVEAAKAAAKAAGATNAQANAAGQDLFEQWAEMTPQQQYQVMQQQLSANLSKMLDEKVGAYWQQAQQQLTNATGMNQQQFDLLARALDAKLSNPKLDLTKVWGTMTDLAKATPDQLMSMAMKAATQDDDFSTRLATEKAKWQEEADKKQAAERLSVLNSDSLNRTLRREEDRPSLNKPGGEEQMKRSILEKALNGEGAFKDTPLHPNQI